MVYSPTVHCDNPTLTLIGLSGLSGLRGQELSPSEPTTVSCKKRVKNNQAKSFKTRRKDRKIERKVLQRDTSKTYIQCTP